NFQSIIWLSEYCDTQKAGDRTDSMTLTQTGVYTSPVSELIKDRGMIRSGARVGRNNVSHFKPNGKN
ncbi:hypothetical protein, partial [Terasakiella sp.]|uniref:hypothetical protein n=1 Tax=Terasakiella sp. TaxID=2034861 RepID=UPI003AA8D54C